MDDRESMIDEVIDKFNFEKVHIAMTAVDWQWQSTDNTGYAVPSIAKLKATARYLLRESIKSKVIGTGGLEAKYHPKIDDDPEFFELKFTLAHSDSYDD